MASRFIPERFNVGTGRFESIDLTPRAVPVGASKPDTLKTMFDRMFNQKMEQLGLVKEEVETDEEFDDFDVEEDLLPVSPYEREDDWELKGNLESNSETIQKDETTEIAPTPTTTDSADSGSSE